MSGSATYVCENCRKRVAVSWDASQVVGITNLLGGGSKRTVNCPWCGYATAMSGIPLGAVLRADRIPDYTPSQVSNILLSPYAPSGTTTPRATPAGGSSALWPWLIGGVAVGGLALWALSRKKRGR